MRFAGGAAILLLVFAMTAGTQQPNLDAGKEIDALFRDYAGDAPGASVLVLRDGKTRFKKSYGLAELETKRRATPRTNYRLASVSKQFTATAVLLLASRGQLSLDDTLPKFFPDFPAYGREIRVRHLLNHSSGLLDYEDFVPRDAAEPVLDAGVLAILQRQDRTYFAPGSAFRYSNSGYALLALIVEKVSGRAFAEFLHRNIFSPLGMRHTQMNLRDAWRKSPRAFGYSRRDAGWERTDQSLTSYVLGDGGIYSSLEDLARWERELAAPRLLRAETLRQAMSSTIEARALAEDRAAAAGEPLGYGYGWFVGTYRGLPVVWHGGSTRGFRTHILRIPGRRLAVIILTNRNEGDVATLARRIADVFSGSLKILED
jgi:CubicO group peptidase (beta-lactamase class C family)